MARSKSDPLPRDEQAAAGQHDLLDNRAYEAAFHLSLEPYALVSVDGLVVAANAALAGLAGTDASLLLEWPFESLFADESKGSVRSLIRRAASWSEAKQEAQILREDGSRLEVDIRASLFVTATGESLIHTTLTDARPRQRRERFYRIALDTARAANEAADEHGVARGLLGTIVSLMPEAAYVAVLLPEAGSGALLPAAEQGFPEGWLAAAAKAPDAPPGKETLSDRVFRRGEGVLIANAALEQPVHALPVPEDAASVIVVPVASGETTLGLLLAATRGRDRFDLDDMKSLELAANEAATALLRVEAARRLAVAESSYRLLLDRVTDGILVLDHRANILEASPSAVAILGWGEEGSPRHLPLALFDDPRQFRSFLHHLHSAEGATGYFRVRGPSQWRYLRVRGTRADVDPVRYVLFIEDAGPEVRERRLRALTNGVDAVVVTAKPGPFPAASLTEAAVAATEAVGAVYLSLTTQGNLSEGARAGLLPDLGEERVVAWIRTHLQNLTPALLRLDGAGERPGHTLTIIPAAAPKGGSVGLLLAQGPDEAVPFEEASIPWLEVVGREIERVLMHHLASEHLRHSLQRERESAERARRMNHELREFTLWTTHDLREPLRSLATLSGYLEEDLEVMSPEEARSVAGKVRQDAEQLKERVLALHEFSVLANEDRPLVEQDVGVAAAAAVEHLRSLIEERKAVVRILPNLPKVRVEAGRLEIVLLNLIANAIKYGPPRRPEVAISANVRDSAVEILVDDNGAGIPPELRERVFRLFYRAPGHHDIPGSGTGLAIVQRIASQHGGHVEVQDSPLGGARFVVRVPLADPVADPVADPGAEAPPEAHGNNPVV